MRHLPEMRTSGSSSLPNFPRQDHQAVVNLPSAIELLRPKIHLVGGEDFLWYERVWRKTRRNISSGLS